MPQRHSQTPAIEDRDTVIPGIYPCPPGVQGCCVARTGTYRAFLGTVVASGNPTALGGGLIEELIKAAVKGVANLLPETKLVSLWTDDLSFSGVLFTYDMYATWSRTVIHFYCCGTNFVNSRLISDKKNSPQPDCGGGEPKLERSEQPLSRRDQRGKQKAPHGINLGNAPRIGHNS